jgi:ABC-type nitrate/sulfonate/bicarbonate transport system ATPase subunit
MTPETDRSLVMESLGIRYGRTAVVEDFSLAMGRETVVLFGPSGCGKTSILKAVLGTALPGMHKSGRILISGRESVVGSGDVRIVLQGPVIPEWIRVRDLCAMGARVKPPLDARTVTEIDATLSAFGILELKDHYPCDLSGGQKQRVSLAVALLGRPEVLLLDEPTTFVDGATRLDIWDFLEKTIQPLRIPTLIVSHDPVEAIRLGDRIVRLSKTSKIEDIIPIELPHPRSELIERTESYWNYRERLGA